MTAVGSRVSTSWRLSAITVALACVFAAGEVHANGTNPTVVAGQASFSTQGSTLSITNSPGTIVNWQGFSIGPGEATRIIQQNAASSILNRVIGPDPSAILGTLISNGRVFLINPSGILVGQGARIDVAGLVASTLNLSNQDFLAGRLNFISNPLAGRVENQGSITTPSGGSVYLVGANVSNSGIINSPQGDVILAAGQSVKIFDSSTPGVRVELTASDNTAVNLGEILAQSGQVGIYGAALRNSGVINADQVGRDAAGKIVLRAKQDVTLDAASRLSANGEQGGIITVQSDAGTTLASGTIEAKGTAGAGGDVQLLGNRVGLIGASVDASGTTGGGTVLVGGDFQGKNPSVKNAQATYVSSDTSIKADAYTRGNGGKVVVWADGSTQAYGSFTAQGGAQSGDGGFVEVSGKHYLDFQGVVNTLAPAGKAGTLLLDPSDITISAGVDAGMTAPGTTSPFTGALATSTLNVTTLTDALALGNVLVDASAGAAAGTGNITVSTVITWSTAKTLELKAGNDVLVSAAFNADTAGAAIKLTAGHDVTVDGALNAHGAGSAITLSAGHNVNVNAALVAPGAASAIELRAGNDGTGAGTVIFGSWGSANAPTTNIYYNPTLYANYAADKTAYSASITGGIGALNTYMLLYVTGLNADKIYNGNLTAVLTGTPTITPAGGDTVNLGGTGSVTNFTNKDVHTEVLTLSGYSISGTEDYKYSLFQPSSLSASITPAPVSFTGTKVYDANGDFAATTFGAAGTITTGIGAENLVLTGIGTVPLTGVLAGSQAVTLGSLALTNGTGTASNYTFTGGTHTATVTAANLLLSGSRVYDGSTVFAGSNLTATGVASETFAITGAGDATNLASKNVQTGSTLASLTGLALGTSGNGGLAGNYTVLSTTGSSVDVTARPITLTAPAVIKTYDGGTTYTTTVADLAGIGALAPLVGSDTISAATIAYTNRDFGLGNKTVTLNGSTISDGNSGLNYTILAENGNSTSTINKAALIVAANPQSKVYGTADPALTYTTGAFQFGDTAGSVLSGALSRAAGENVGSYFIGQNTLVSNANYTVAYTGNNLGITPAALHVIANPQSKIFGTNDPALTFGVAGLVNNPALGINDTAATVLSGALTRVSGESALGGPYAITQGSLVANGNYTLGYTRNNLIITGVAVAPVLGFDPGQVIFTGIINNDYYHRPGNFWHISLNFNNADPGFDVMRGTSDVSSPSIRRRNSCGSVFGGGFCETWSFPQQFEKVDK
jgi:filamentous hemagglutinin family protein